MIICPNKTQCGKLNSYRSKYCVYCGTKLNNTIPSWPFACGNAKRTSSYPVLNDAPQFKDKVQVSMEHDFFQDKVDNISNLPQPIMANNILWIFARKQAVLFGIKLSYSNGYLTVKKDKADLINSGLNMNDTPLYANTPAFDGVFLNLIYDDKFARISTYDGKPEGQIITDGAFKFIQQAAPLIVTLKDTKKNFIRYFITVLKYHILIVDITRKNYEDYHLIPWNNDDDDEMRSPVFHRTNVYFVSKKGKILYIPINIDFKSIKKIRSPKKLITISPKTPAHFSAPLIIHPYIIMEYFLPKNDNICFRYLMLINLKNVKNRSKYPICDSLIKNIILKSNLPGLLINGYAYYSIRNNKYLRVKPGVKPSIKKFENNDFPGFWPLNAISIGTKLFVYHHPKNQIIIQETEGHPEQKSIDIHSNIDRSPLCGQPVVFGKILSLFFSNRIVFITI